MSTFAGILIADRYLLERELGRGGMASVWLARDQRDGNAVAVKILHAELAGAIGTDRFVREIRITSDLQHPSIVAIFDSGILRSSDGSALPWYAMPYLDGESLRTRLAREHQLPVEDALAIAEAVGRALQAAHQRGIVHRDIKPENVFLSRGQVHVVDFGIAKALVETGGERLTSTGLAIGTPAYMSPEQALAQPVDARSDQYSLATLIYEMLAGEPPFLGSTPQAILARRLTEAARPLGPLRSTVPATVERAVLRALERAPADRFPDVASFLATLRAPGDAGRVLQRRHTSVTRILVALVAATVIAIVGWLGTQRSRVAARQARDTALLALYQRGTRAYDRRTSAGIVEAVASFRAALARDSTYTAAWTGLAKSYVRAYQRTFVIPGVSRDSVLLLAIAAADRALYADTMSAEAWLSRALAMRFVDPTDLTMTLRAVRRALVLDSAMATGLHTLAITLADVGDLKGATDAWRRCVRTHPTNIECLGFLGQAHYWHRAYDSASVWADSAIAVDPGYVLGRQVSGHVEVERGDFVRAAAAFEAARRLVTDVELVNYLAAGALVEARAGRNREARSLLRRADSLARFYAPPQLHTVVYVAQAYAALGDTDQATAVLKRFEPLRDLHFQLHLRCDPAFDPLRRHQPFRSFLRADVPSGC